jgi:MFS family permease
LLDYVFKRKILSKFKSAILALLIKFFGKKETIIVGLIFQVIQLALYGITSNSWFIWFAGLLAAISSISYPAISAFISNHASADSQGVAQGMVTGIRGLCNGLGPALYGLIFWVFHVDLNENSNNNISNNVNNMSNQDLDKHTSLDDVSEKKKNCFLF